MATIDPSIAMGYRPVQIENPLNQLAAVSQIQRGQQDQQLNMLKMQEYQRGLEEENKLRTLLSGGGDINSPDVIRQMYGISPTKGLEFQQKQALIKKAGLETTGLELKNFDDAMKQSRNLLDMVKTPEQYIAWHEANHRNPLIGPRLEASGVTVNQSRQHIMDMLAQPGGLDKLITESKVGATKFIELNKPTIQNITRGGISEQIQTPGLGGAPVVTRTAEVTATPGDIMTDARARERLKIEQQRLAADLDPNVQAKLAASKAAGTTAGKTQAAAAIALPNAIATSESLLGKIDAMIGTPAVRDKSGKVINAGTAPHPGFTGAVGMGRGYTLGIPGIEQLIPGTPAADFKARFDEIMGGAFLEAFETLKGGGAITETEGKKATAAKTRMSLAQSENEFLAAAREYKDIVKTGIERARKKAGQAPSGGVDYDALVNKYTQ
jgi:hypothetical protein